MLGRYSEDEIWSRFVFELLIWPNQVALGPLCLWQCSRSKTDRLTSLPLSQMCLGIDKKNTISFFSRFFLFFWSKTDRLTLLPLSQLCLGIGRGKDRKDCLRDFLGREFSPDWGEKTVKQLEVRKNERNKNCIKKGRKKHFEYRRMFVILLNHWATILRFLTTIWFLKKKARQWRLLVDTFLERCFL